MDGSICKTSRFEETLAQSGLKVKRDRITTLQVNIGKRCNQACHHCHVEAGPKRTENMERETVDRILELLKAEPDITLVDITGGAPELNPHFRTFVEHIRAMGKDVIDRCNLTVLFEKGQEDTAEFLAKEKVQIVASLPCYLEDNVNAQRGKCVFGKSISALEKLNALGYGKPDSGLILNLVYNPVGTHLLPEQKKLEAAYKEHLHKNFGLVFNSLFTITNMPIKRFAHMLERDGLAEAPHAFRLDDHHLFRAGMPERVCGNTWKMLMETRFASHFTSMGNFTTHYGAFDCVPSTGAESNAPAGACC